MISSRRNSIVIGIAVLMLIGTGIFLYKHMRSNPTALQGDYSEPDGMLATSTAGITGNAVAESAWQVFNSYLAAAKAHDISTLKQHAYRISAACADPSKKDACDAVMDRVSKAGETFKETDFKNIAYDNRQIILSTDWHLEKSEVQVGYGRSVIYFARTTDGVPHVLFFTQPEEIIYSFIDPEVTLASLVSRLNERIKDSDGDFLEDEYETCSYQGAASSTPPCIATDPHSVDTNGNGWWDSVEAYIR